MKSRKQKNIIVVSLVLITLFFLIPLGLSAMIYEGNFGERYIKYPPMSRSMDEFEGLNSQRYTFPSNDGQTLVGYKYYREIDDTDAKGVVIIAHGLGGGGHNSYIDVANYFSLNGYDVFAYDATGNDESEGNSVKGIPQGLIDLDYAINFVKETLDFENLPIFLFGHSWGGYSVGSSLNSHPDVKAIVMVSGFNHSMDIIEEEGRKVAGDRINIILPYISLYERMKFGRYGCYNTIDGFGNTQAGVMIIYSADDDMISQEKAYDIFYDIYKDNPRFNFIKYNDRGHDYVYYSDSSRKYKEDYNKGFDEYIKSLKEDFTAELKESYLNNNLDKKLLFSLDEELMNNIVNFYDDYLEWN